MLPQVLTEKCGNLRVLEVLFESCTCWLSRRLLIISLQGLGLGHLGAPIDLFVMSFGLFDPVFDLFFLESKCRQLLFALEDCKLYRLLILCRLVVLIAQTKALAMANAQVLTNALVLANALALTTALLLARPWL